MKKFFTSLAFFFTGMLIAVLPKPYASINVLPFDSHGWFYNEPQLNDLLANKPIKTVIEVGTWLGLSARFFANKVQPSGKVYCVDNWKGSEATKSDPRLPCLYHQFLSNTIHANLCDILIPISMDSLVAAKALNVMADLIYIDATHTSESVYNQSQSIKISSTGTPTFQKMELCAGMIGCGNRYVLVYIKQQMNLAYL